MSIIFETAMPFIKSKQKRAPCQDERMFKKTSTVQGKMFSARMSAFQNSRSDTAKRKDYKIFSSIKKQVATSVFKILATRKKTGGKEVRIEKQTPVET